jgi:hypothetical protein
VEKTSITIADTVLVQLEATAQPPYKVKMPKIDEALKNFGMIDWNSFPSRLDANNNVVTMNQYRLEPFISGTYPIPGFTFEFYDANEPNAVMHKLSSEPVDIEVASLLGEDRENLAIADIEGVVEMPAADAKWWLWAGAGLGVAAIAAVVLVRARGRKIARLVRILRPAHEVAYERLRLLVADGLVEKGMVKEFYERISDILRHYIEDRFELHAPERTTEEFLFELQSAGMLTTAQKATLAEFLNHCDLVKFAKHEPTSEQIQRTFDLTKDFIEKTKSDEYQVDITDRVESGVTDAA